MIRHKNASTQITKKNYYYKISKGWKPRKEKEIYKSVDMHCNCREIKYWNHWALAWKKRKIIEQLNGQTLLIVSSSLKEGTTWQSITLLSSITALKKYNCYKQKIE